MAGRREARAEWACGSAGSTSGSAEGRLVRFGPDAVSRCSVAREA